MNLSRTYQASLILVLLAGSPGAYAYDSWLEPLRVQPMQPSGAVHAIAQTRDGHVWFAAHDGLYRSDGDSIERFGTAPPFALPHDQVFALRAAADGSLWIGFAGAGVGSSRWEHGGGGIVRWKDGRFHLFTRDDNLRDDWARRFVDDPDGAIWIATPSGLSRWLEGSFRTFAKADGVPEVLIHNVFVSADKTVWVGTAQGVFSRPHANAVFVPAGLDDPIVAFAESDDGALWLTNRRFLYRHHPSRPGRFEKIDLLGTAQINALSPGDNNSLWVATSLGLFLIQAKAEGGAQVLRQIGVDDGLPDINLTCLARDREGGLWVGTRAGGVARISKPTIWNFSAREGLAGNVGFAIVPSRNGGLWMSSGWGVSRFADGAFTNFLYGKDLQSDMARSLAEDGHGRLLMSAGRSGITRFDGKTLSRFPLPGKQDRGEPLSLIVDDAGDLWVSWMQGGASVFPNADLDRDGIHFDPDSLCHGRLWALAKGSQGGIWAGSDNGGLARATRDGGHCTNPGDGKPGQDILGLLEDDDGALWIGGRGAPGLLRFQNGRFTRFSQGIASVAYGIVGDQAGYLWFSSRTGVYRVRKANLEAFESARVGQIDWLRFSNADGLRVDEGIAGMFPVAAIAPDGRFWFAHLLGVSAVAPPEHVRVSATAVPLVKSIVANDVAVNVASGAPVPPGRGNVQIEYTAPWFSVPQQVSFEYRLTGFDTDWIPAGSRRAAQYTNLPPGKYQFDLRARVANQPFVMAVSPAVIELRPHFYQTRWFIVLLIATIASVFFGGHRLRLRRMEQHHRAIHGERARLARELHDNLGQGFTSLGYHLDAIKNLPDPSRANAVVDRARSILGHCQTETRRLIWSLRSEEDGNRDLAYAIENVLSDARIEGGPVISFQPERAADFLAVDAQVLHEAPLVVKEAVTNALRHAAAKQIVVTLSRQNHSARITITDDGRGMEPRPTGDTRSGSFGLLGIQERARRINAELVIKTAPGEGMIVTLVVPNAWPEHRS